MKKFVDLVTPEGVAWILPVSRIRDFYWAEAGEGVTCTLWLTDGTKVIWEDECLVEVVWKEIKRLTGGNN